jgi:hypothetical protein
MKGAIIDLRASLDTSAAAAPLRLSSRAEESSLPDALVEAFGVVLGIPLKVRFRSVKLAEFYEISVIQRLYLFFCRII